LVRAAVSPEEIGLCGCWQIAAVKRESLDLTVPDEPPTVEIGYYVSSLSAAEADFDRLGQIIRGHWSAIENGTHYRRDVTLGEDANRTAHPVGAEVLASFRNLANGLYELQKLRGLTQVDTFKSWCEQQTFSSAWKLLRR
jgi:predicted transposase YbfD/YdcC